MCVCVCVCVYIYMYIYIYIDDISLNYLWNEKCSIHKLQGKSKHTFRVQFFFGLKIMLFMS